MMIGSRISSTRDRSGSLAGFSTLVTVPSRCNLIHHRRCGSDEVHVVPALQPFLDHIHVQQAKEAAAKAKTKRLRHLRFKVQEASLSFNFSSASRSASYWFASTG